MKSYFIFTIVLTVAYLVYYAVIIVQDLYGNKGNGKPEEEVFDLGAPEDEQLSLIHIYPRTVASGLNARISGWSLCWSVPASC